MSTTSVKRNMFLCSKKAKNPSPKSSQTGFLGPGPVTGFVTDLLPNRGRNAEKMGTLKVTGLALYNFTNHPNSLLSRLLACYSGGGGLSHTVSTVITVVGEGYKSQSLDRGCTAPPSPTPP